MIIGQFLVGLNLKILSFYFCSFNPYGSTRYSWLRFFSLIFGCVVLIQLILNKKIQTIGIQFKPGLNE
jgi:hypothetical protein